MKTPEYKLTPREEDSAVQAIALSIPREQYVEGKIKLDYRYKFSTGEVFMAKEGQDGGVAVLLFRDGKTIFNFQTLLPERGYFVTPSYIQKLIHQGTLDGAPKEFKGGWEAFPALGVVNIGDMHNPKEIFNLLHEIGHTHETREQLLKQSIGVTVNNVPLPIVLKKKSEANVANNKSKQERNAWAWTLRMARKIQKECGVDFFEVFKSRADFEELLYGSLVTYRAGIGEDLVEKNQGKSSFWSWKPQPEDLKFLRGLFDKERLQRGGDQTTIDQEVE